MKQQKENRKDAVKLNCKNTETNHQRIIAHFIELKNKEIRKTEKKY